MNKNTTKNNYDSDSDSNDVIDLEDNRESHFCYQEGIKEFVDFLSILKEINMDLDIMIEAKMKDDALFRLVRQLKYLNYKVEGTTIYI